MNAREMERSTFHVNVVLNTQPCNGQLEKNCEGNEKETNGSSMPKRNKVGEEKRKNECGELKKHGLPKSTKPEQEKRDGGRNKNTHS